MLALHCVYKAYLIGTLSVLIYTLLCDVFHISRHPVLTYEPSLLADGPCCPETFGMFASDVTPVATYPPKPLGRGEIKSFSTMIEG